MKKYLLAFIGMLSIYVASNASETLYHSTFNSEAEVDGWTIIDNNNDGCTWGYSEYGDEGKRFYYSYSGSNQADDWAITPAITPTETGRVLVKFQYTGSVYVESMKIYYGTEATPDALQQNLVADFPAIDSEMHGGYAILDVTAGQPIYLGFYAYSGEDRFRLYLNELTVLTLEGEPVDLALTAINSPITGEGLGQEAVKVTIKNVGNSDVDSFDVSYTINGGEAVTETVNQAIAQGDEYEYTFKALADLSETRKLYTIKATVNHESDIETTNNSTSIDVRNYADGTEPYSMGFERDEDTSRVKFFNLNEDEGDWEIAVGSWYMNLARTGNYCIAYNYDKENNANDWAILEPVKISAGYHVLKFWYSGSDGHTEKLRVAYGSEPTPDAMKTTIIDLPKIDQAEYQESITIFKVDKEQTIYIGFQAYSDKDENWLSIDDISLDAIDENEVDMIISNLSSIGDYVPQADYKRVTFDLYNMSVNDADATVKVFVDDALVANNTEHLLAEQKRTITYSSLLDNVAEGEHTIKVTVENDADTNSSNNEVSKTTRFLGTPDILYDFEDGKLPEDILYYAEDDGTFDSSVIDELGENGIGITGIETHALYGNYMFIASTYVDLEYSSELDRVIVFPPIHVNSDDACVAWNAGSFNESYPVSYRFMANDGTWGFVLENKWYYDFLKSVTKQGTTRVNEGASLGGYNGKDVYVAIHLYGDPGDAIVFDNIQFHGCSMVAGVSDRIFDRKLEINVNGDVIHVATGDDVLKSVAIYDVNGRMLAKSKASTLSISNLPKGVYIVKAATENATKTIKIVN